jgi:hypothetical protein
MSRRAAPARRSRRGEAGGFVTVQYLAATAFALVLLVLAANVLVDLYVRAAVRDALDEGTRAAVPAAADASTCRRRAQDVVASLARGPVARGIRIDCRISGEQVLADAHVSLPSFVPWLMPTWTLDLHAAALREPE